FSNLCVNRNRGEGQAMPAPKPTAEHERDGTFRKGRHSDRADGLFPSGPPRMPSGLDGHQKWMWRLGVENVPDRVGSPAGAAELVMLCTWWSQFRQIADDVDNAANAKERLFHLNTLAMASKRVADGLKRFGMNPASRTMLKVSGKPKGGGALSALLEAKEML